MNRQYIQIETLRLKEIIKDFFYIWREISLTFLHKEPFDWKLQQWLIIWLGVYSVTSHCLIQSAYETMHQQDMMISHLTNKSCLSKPRVAIHIEITLHNQTYSIKWASMHRETMSRHGRLSIIMDFANMQNIIVQRTYSIEKKLHMSLTQILHIEKASDDCRLWLVSRTCDKDQIVVIFHNE